MPYNFGLESTSALANMEEVQEQLWLSLYNIVKMGGNGRRKQVWVFVPTGERVNIDEHGFNSVLWGKVKHNAEVYAKIVQEAGLEGERENELDKRALDILGSWVFRANVEKLPMKNEEDIAVDRSSKERMLSKELLYPCCNCSRSFAFKHQLRRHVARVHLDTSYQCPSSPKKFARQDRLQCHQLLHYAPNVCITCKKKYRTKSALLKWKLEVDFAHCSASFA